jgi:periplasmic divalent cation tolerance protein
MSARLIYSTWPDQAQAIACARDLLERRLAACVTVLPAAASLFRWDGALQETTESIMLAKTRASAAMALRDAITTAHPYDLPCVLSLAVDPEASNAEFLQWISMETHMQSPEN